MGIIFHFNERVQCIAMRGRKCCHSIRNNWNVFIVIETKKKTKKLLLKPQNRYHKRTTNKIDHQFFLNKKNAFNGNTSENRIGKRGDFHLILKYRKNRNKLSNNGSRGRDCEWIEFVCILRSCGFRLHVFGLKRISFFVAIFSHPHSNAERCIKLVSIFTFA